MASLETQEVGEDEVALPMCDPNYDYYSIDNILEEDILLKVKPLSTILQAHCLRESDNNGTIPSDCEIELPAWIAIPLIRNGIVELIEPKEFNSSFLSQLWAEPSVINLRYRCTSFYEMGYRYAQLTNNPSLMILLLKTYLDRSQLLSKTAQRRYDKDNTTLLQKMTDSEQRLFHSIVDDVCAENTWWSRKCQESCYTLAEFKEKRQRLKE